MNRTRSYNEYYQLLLKQQESSLSLEEAALLKEGKTLFPALVEAEEQFAQQRKLLLQQKYAFKPFFTGRVIHRLRSIGEQQNFSLMYAFKRLAVPAFGVICIWLLSLFFVDGSLELDSIVGLADWDTVDEYTFGDWIN